MYFSPKKVSKVWSRSQSLLKLLLWIKGVEWVKVLDALGPLCLWQCINTNPETKFFRYCYWNTLWDKIFSKCYLYLFGKWYQHSYNFKGNRLFSHYLSWIMRNSKTFLRPLQRFFLDQIQTNSETFLRPKFLRPIPRPFFETEIFDTDTNIAVSDSIQNTAQFSTFCPSVLRSSRAWYLNFSW